MKKGFTLVELLAVMVIISIVSIITVPTVTDLLNKNKTKLCNAQIDEIISAAKSWGTENVFSLPNNDGGSITISLKKLSEEGYIDEKIKNPVTNAYFDLDETVVTITKNGKKYSYTMNDSVVDTCYSNGTEKPSDSNLSNKTTIIYRYSSDHLFNGDKIDLKNRKYTNYTKYDKEADKVDTTNETHDMVGVYSKNLNDVLTITTDYDGSTIDKTNIPYYLKHIINSEGIILKSEVCLKTSLGTLCHTGGEGVKNINGKWNDPNYEAKKQMELDFFKWNNDTKTSEYDSWYCEIHSTGSINPGTICYDDDLNIEISENGYTYASSEDLNVYCDVSYTGESFCS